MLRKKKSKILSKQTKQKLKSEEQFTLQSLIDNPFSDIKTLLSGDNKGRSKNTRQWAIRLHNIKHNCRFHFMNAGLFTELNIICQYFGEGVQDDSGFSYDADFNKGKGVKDDSDSPDESVTYIIKQLRYMQTLQMDENMKDTPESVHDFLDHLTSNMTVASILYTLQKLIDMCGGHSELKVTSIKVNSSKAYANELTLAAYDESAESQIALYNDEWVDVTNTDKDKSIVRVFVPSLQDVQKVSIQSLIYPDLPTNAAQAYHEAMSAADEAVKNATNKEMAAKDDAQSIIDNRGTRAINWSACKDANEAEKAAAAEQTNILSMKYTILLRYAILQIRRSQYEKSEELLNEAITLDERLSPNSNHYEAYTIYAHLEVNKNRGDPTQAEPYYRSAIDRILENLKDGAKAAMNNKLFCEFVYESTNPENEYMNIEWGPKAIIDLNHKLIKDALTLFEEYVTKYPHHTWNVDMLKKIMAFYQCTDDKNVKVITHPDSINFKVGTNNVRPKFKNIDHFVPYELREGVPGRLQSPRGS